MLQLSQPVQVVFFASLECSTIFLYFFIVGLCLLDSVVEVVSQFVSLNLKLSKFISQLLNLAEFTLKRRMLFIALLSSAIELEFLSSDLFLFVDDLFDLETVLFLFFLEHFDIWFGYDICLFGERWDFGVNIDDVSIVLILILPLGSRSLLARLSFLLSFVLGILGGLVLLGL